LKIIIIKGQILGQGGSINEELRIKSGIDSDQSVVVTKIHQNVDQLTKDATYQKNSFNDLLRFLKEKRSIIAATPSICLCRARLNQSLDTENHLSVESENFIRELIFQRG
jgi:hypothetical protein